MADSYIGIWTIPRSRIITTLRVSETQPASPAPGITQTSSFGWAVPRMRAAPTSGIRLIAAGHGSRRPRARAQTAISGTSSFQPMVAPGSGPLIAAKLSSHATRAPHGRFAKVFPLRRASSPTRSIQKSSMARRCSMESCLPASTAELHSVRNH